jgi:hypothetical protein
MTRSVMTTLRSGKLNPGGSRREYVPMRQSELDDRFSLPHSRRIALLVFSFVATWGSLAFSVGAVRPAAYACAAPFFLLGAIACSKSRDSTATFVPVAATVFVLSVAAANINPLYLHAVTPQSKWSYPLADFVAAQEGIWLAAAAVSFFFAAAYLLVRELAARGCVDYFGLAGIVCCVVAAIGWYHRCSLQSEIFSPF